MPSDRIEGKWIDLFADVFARCKVAPGDACAILSESQSRELRAGMRLLKQARLMKVTSSAGTDLSIGVEGARVGGVWGYSRAVHDHGERDEPGEDD